MTRLLCLGLALLVCSPVQAQWRRSYYDRGPYGRGGGCQGMYTYNVRIRTLASETWYATEADWWSMQRRNKGDLWTAINGRDVKLTSGRYVFWAKWPNGFEEPRGPFEICCDGPLWLTR